MAENVELLKYKLDISDVEAKARQMLDLTEKIAVGKRGGTDTSELEQELERVHGGFVRAGQAARSASGSAFDFDAKTERLAKNLLSTANPALGQTADLMFDLIESGGKLSGRLLAVAGTAAAVGGVISTLKAITDQIKAANRELAEMSNALAKVREKGVSDQEAAGRAALEAGVAGGGGAIMEDRARLGERGIPADFAQSATIARLISGPDYDEAAYLRGLVMAGGKDIGFSGNRQEDLASVQRRIDAGRDPKAENAFSQFLGDVGPNARRNVPLREAVYQTVSQAEIDRVIDRVRQRGGYSEEELGRAREALTNPEMMAKLRAAEESEGDKSIPAALLNKIIDPVFRGLTRMVGAESSPAELLGTIMPEGDVNALRAAREANRFSYSEFSSSAQAAGTPVMINDHRQYIGTQINGGGSARTNPNFDAARHAPGGGMVDKNPGE